MDEIKFRYTLIKDFKKKILTPSLIGLTMGAYSQFLENGWKVVKREIEINGKFKEIP